MFFRMRDGSLIVFVYSKERPGDRRFAGAGFSHQSYDLSFTDRKTHIAQNLHRLFFPEQSALSFVKENI